MKKCFLCPLHKGTYLIFFKLNFPLMKLYSNCQSIRSRFNYFQLFNYMMRRADSFEKTLMLWGQKKGVRGWDGWMASLTQWTWVWVNSRSWWWTGRPGVLWFMRSQRVGHDWATELNWTELIFGFLSTDLTDFI